MEISQVIRPLASLLFAVAVTGCGYTKPTMILDAQQQALEPACDRWARAHVPSVGTIVDETTKGHANPTLSKLNYYSSLYNPLWFGLGWVLMNREKDQRYAMLWAECLTNPKIMDEPRLSTPR